MNDFNALTTWVQPQHLATSAIDGYRADFESRTVHMLHITDFLKADKVTRLARFFGQEATFNQIYGLYATDGGIKGKRVSDDGWRAADKGSRWYTYGLLADPDPRFRFSPNLITCLDLYRVLVTSAFRAYVSALTGLPLGDFLNHVAMQMRPGDFLGPHSDDGEGCRLAIVFYLSPAWKADYGGVLHIIGKNDEYFKIEATFNSFVVFDVKTHKSHHITNIRGTAGDQSRLTMPGWFCDPEHQ